MIAAPWLIWFPLERHQHGASSAALLTGFGLERHYGLSCDVAAGILEINKAMTAAWFGRFEMEGRHYCGSGRITAFGLELKDTITASCCISCKWLRGLVGHRYGTLAESTHSHQ